MRLIPRDATSLFTNCRLSLENLNYLIFVLFYQFKLFFSHKFLMNINQDFILDPLNCLRIFCKNSYTSFRRVESLNYKRLKLFATFSFCTNYEQNLRELNFILPLPIFNQGQVPCKPRNLNS